MPVQRRTKWLVAGTMGTAAVGLVLGYVVWTARSGRTVRPATAPASSAIVDSPLARINEKLRRSVPKALSELQLILTAKTAGKGPAMTLSTEEATEWIATLTSIRAGFLNYATPARGSAGLLSTMVLNKFAVDPAPRNWIEALPPIHNIMTACLSDSEPVVRVVGLNEVAKLWAWIPGRSLTPFEEQTLAEWKQALYQPVVRCLASRDAATRVSAVACLGALPFDEAAAPAVAYLEDQQSLDVRKQTLVSFAARPALLTEDMLLKRVHDEDMSIRETALAVLKARGLSSEQIALGSLIFNPKPELRLSVIPQLKERTDIDPVIWLLELSRDPVDAVRIGAIRALADSKGRSVSVNRRLAEIATSDRSEDVRRVARKFVPSGDETTASLPPLPGSSVLNPRAN
jgi:hypothetical protein